MSWISDRYSYGWGAGIVSGGLIYHYGYPAFGSLEANVLGQWLFDEASGSIVDEVGAVTCTVTGSPTFSVTASGAYLGISPGITYATLTRHEKTTDTPGLAIGTNNFTIEIWYKTSDSLTALSFIVFHHANTTPGGHYIQLNHVTGVLTLNLRASDDTAVTRTYTLPASWNDGTPHKLRFVGVRTANCTLIFDGATVSAADISGLSGKTLSAPVLNFGNIISSAGSAYFPGTLFEYRVSANATNNSGGVNGG